MLIVSNIIDWIQKVVGSKFVWKLKVRFGWQEEKKEKYMSAEYNSEVMGAGRLLDLIEW